MSKSSANLVTTAVSTLLTAAIILILIFVVPGTSQAVTVTLTPSSTSVVPGESITFDVTVVIQPNERIPINGVHLRLFSDAACSTELTASPYNSPRSMSLVSATPPTDYYGYGYGYGYDPNVGEGYYFGYGYGYGYDYGYGYGYGGAVTLVYRCTVDTTGWAAGTYYARGDVDSGTHTFSSSIISFVVAYDWDVNSDGCINVLDLILVGQHWGETGAPGWIREDVNEDGVINVLDLILVGQHWAEGCP